MGVFPGRTAGGLALTAFQILGLLGTGAIVWRTTVGPRLRHESPAAVVVDAVVYALLAWAVSAAIALGISASLSRSGWRRSCETALRTSRTAVWFAPACILLSNLSPAAVIPALALIFGATRLVYSDWRRNGADQGGVVSEQAAPFQLLPSPLAIRTLAPALAVSLGAQAGIIAAGAGFHLLAAASFATAASMLTVLLLTAGILEPESQQSLPRSVMGLMLTLILAAGLTTVHVLSRNPGSGPGFGEPGDSRSPGPLDSARELMKKLTQPDFIDTDEPLDTATKLYRAPDTGVDLVDNVFPGVILRAEVKTYVTLVAPRPSWLKRPAAARSAGPFSIPFSGEYWMFKPPHTRPPKGAITRTGTPLALFYRTTDHRKLSMEARQRFEHPIALACCSAIRVELLNADSHPGTLSLEVVLADSRVRGKPPLSLGTQRVRAWPEAGTPVRDTLEFRVPASAPLQSFDELRVIMHRDLVRGDKSARISIERFLLLPRG